MSICLLGVTGSSPLELVLPRNGVPAAVRTLPTAAAAAAEAVLAANWPGPVDRSVDAVWLAPADDALNENNGASGNESLVGVKGIEAAAGPSGGEGDGDCECE